MPAYILVALTLHDRDTYQRYVQAFVPAFLQRGGEILAVQDDPEALEGAWPFSRLVILRMPSEAAFRAWYDSPEYQAIAQDRYRAAVTHITVLPEFRMPPRTAPSAE